MLTVLFAECVHAWNNEIMDPPPTGNSHLNVVITIREAVPRGHMTFIQRCINVDAMSFATWRLYNVALTSMQRHMTHDVYTTSQ